MTKRLLTICSVLGLLLGATSLLAQSDIGSVGKYELNLYGGGSWWKQQAEAPRMKFVDGGTFGVRFTQNYWKYVGIEEAFNIHGVNNARFDVPGSTATTAFGHRVRGFTIAPVFHFTPRESRFRPFLLAGPGFNWFGPTSDAQNQASRPNGGGLGQPSNLQSELSPIFNYGGGLKMKMHKYVGLRFDARGTVSRTPSLGIPSFGPANVVTFSRRGPLNGAQVTGGLTFYMGKLAEPVMGEFRTGAIEASSLTACPGDKVTFRLPVTNTMTGVGTKYNWSLGGQSVGTGDSFTMTAPDKPGSYDIKVTAEPDTSAAKKDVLNYIKKNAITAKTLNQAVTVKEYRKPTVSASSSPTSITVGQRATLTASGTGSECSGTLTYSWTSDCDGLTANGATAVFAPTGVGQGQTRNCVATVRITDSKGGSATAQTVVAVRGPAPPPPPPPPPSLQPMQLDDIVFANGSGRVNNCGKRILDQVYERVQANPDYDVLLVGHYDAKEEKKATRRVPSPAQLDSSRVMAAAAFLTAGTQPCKNLEISRVKVAMLGKEQGSAFKTNLCEASVRERAGSRVSAKDENAKNRRVEVWLVPRTGKGPMPAGISGVMNAPASDVQKLGCPK